MTALLKVVPLCVAAIGAIGDANAQPRAGSQLPADANSCAACHGSPDLWEGDQQRLFISEESLAEDVHGNSGVNCHDCHGGDPQEFDVPKAHSKVVDQDGSEVKPFRFPLDEVKKACAKCHASQSNGVASGVHGQAGAKRDTQHAMPRDCSACHGEKAHGMVSVRDAQSPVFVDNQVRLCGSCHEKELQEYDTSVHGHGLRKSGLQVTAVCANCHGAHGILPASDAKSSLHASNVAGTCAKCHRFIEERLQKSVHGRGNGPGAATEEPAPGGKVMRRPSCTDCHQGHDVPNPQSVAFRLRSPGRCGDCHVDLSRRYGMSLHGALTDLGYGPGAKCSDCHGAHDILPVSEPASRLAPGENRLATCRNCHPRAVPNFCDFHPHADYEDAEKYPWLHAVRWSMELLIFSVFAFFGLHTILWFVRSTVHVLRHGRPQRLAGGRVAYVRFESIHRALHVVVAVSFLGLALTGLPLRYSGEAWAQMLARGLGGFRSTSLWHHIFGVVTIVYFVSHLVWLARRAIARRKEKTGWNTLFFGPDSPLPNVRDVVDLLRMLRWFVGLGPKPVFERWTYWEKFDYWAVFWGVAIIGTSGLMLWFPSLFCRFLPGGALNVAKIIHSEEALLATSFIFLIHFFGTHLRPEKFPMDLSILSGLVSEEELHEERPEFLQRMREEGKLEQLRQTLPSRTSLWPIMLGGFLALAIGLALLLGMLLAGFGG